VDRADAVTAAAAILGVIARRGRIARAREILQAEGAAAFTAPVEKWLSAAPAPRPGPPAASIGSHTLGNGAIAIGIGLPFGQADASVLAQLAAAAREAGTSGLAPTMGRTLLAIGLSRDSAGAFTDAAERLGFLVRADDPRQAIIACAGAPACASARIPTRRIAAAIARAAAPMLDGTRRIHLSGCAKGCASADPAALTIVGGAAGCGIVTEGTTADEPEEVVALGALAGRIAELAMRTATQRLPGNYRAPTRRNALPPEPVHE
jgi:precorrin-3B synthase